MIEKIVHKSSLESYNEIEMNLKFWLSKTPEERVDAMEIFRRQYVASSERIQPVFRIIKKK